MGRASRRKKQQKQQNQPQQGRWAQLTREQANEFMRVVHDDLTFLRAQDRRSPSRTDVRIASSILRRLFFEGDFQAAWTLVGLGGYPTFTAVDLLASLGEVPRGYIHYAYAGGAQNEGAQHSGMTMFVLPKGEVQPGEEAAAAQRLQQQMTAGTARAFSLPEFIHSPAVVSGEASVSRLDVLRYVANKSGGVHWDERRKEWTDPMGSRHRLLDEQHIMVGWLTGAMYEVLSMAHSVATAEDTVRLIERIEQIAPEEVRQPNVISFREGRIGKYADMTYGPKQPAESMGLAEAGATSAGDSTEGQS